MPVNADRYQCSGTMDPKNVSAAFKRLVPVWQQKDLTECNRLEDARMTLGPAFSANPHVHAIRSLWPVQNSVADGPYQECDYQLPMGSLGLASFLPLFRGVEQLIIDERLAPMLVYWSRHTAARFLPSGQRYRELLRDAYCLSIFSEDQEEPPDEWCFLLESRGLCLIVYGQQDLGEPRYSENIDRLFFFGDEQPPHDSGVPRRPHPSSGDTDVALPEPSSEIS